MSLKVPPPVLARLRAAQHVVALTGAGISAESGVPTFRDAQTGLWAKYRAEDLATPEAFRKDPALVWNWYAWRRSLTAEARPNPGHRALVTLEQMVPRFTLLTQNVDGLHVMAGSREVIELHGNLQRTLCFDEGTEVTSFGHTGELPPRCPRCGGLLRPGVVWFGESVPREELSRAEGAVTSADVLLSIGTSSLVHPAAGLPLMAKRAGALLIEINPRPTPLTAEADWVVAQAAGKALPALLTALQGG
jgi:NAD-dependent deacetylase